ncbi:MAG: serine hydrolase [Gammaproteobacteria bacterium]|nr:serine hydrolase [Gammaproteobacteria bacterium]
MHASALPRTLRCLALAVLGASASLAGAYPLDGEAESGLRRLQGYANAQSRTTGAKLPAGSLLSIDDVTLTLAGVPAGPDFDAVPPNAELQASLESIFSKRDPSYGVVVVDMSDPRQVIWAGLRPDTKQNPGSVGKLLTMVGLFDALARAFPDPQARARVLRDTVVQGGDWVISDEHEVPRFDAAAGVNRFAVVQPDDRFRLSEWLDHMISPSANAAGSVVWREAMLIRRFGAEYPVEAARAEAFFRETPRSELSALSLELTAEPLARAGIDTGNIQQGSFWTRTGKQRVPGTVSFATPRELARILFRMEQGRLVDAWSSLEMKRYLYMTKRRYRYVYAPELHDAAVYFKSGSLYSCQPEEGFRCRKYMGNKRNLMNSVAIVESPASAGAASQRRQTRYLVALVSNVLRVNSAWDHSRFAVAIDQAVKTRREVEVKEKAGEAEMKSAGES